MITHKGTQTIHTERLILRKFTVDDAQAMFENWANDERVTRYLTWCPHESPEATKQLLELWCAAYEKPNTYNWVMEYEGILLRVELLKNAVLHLKEQSALPKTISCFNRGRILYPDRLFCGIRQTGKRIF